MYVLGKKEGERLTVSVLLEGLYQAMLASHFDPVPSEATQGYPVLLLAKRCGNRKSPFPYSLSFYILHNSHESKVCSSLRNLFSLKQRQKIVKRSFSDRKHLPSLPLSLISLSFHWLLCCCAHGFQNRHCTEAGGTCPMFGRNKKLLRKAFVT